MCSLLGADVANREPSHIKPYFTFNDSKVHIMYDPSHMIKLVRNIFAHHKILYDNKNEKIEWRYIENLYKYSVVHNVKNGHKVTKEHIDFSHHKMKVKLATQVLSDSAADTIERLMNCNCPEFQGAKATIRFIRNFNNIFDIFNSRHKHYEHENIFKRPINALNKNDVFEFCNEMMNYISSFKFTPSPTSPYIINTDSKCGFRGFLVNIKSLQAIYTEYVEEGDMFSLPTFHFSQDFLELLFGRIRSMGGFNDNPTAVQFRAAYRKLIRHSKIVTSNKGNVDDICSKAFETNILTISSSNKPFLAPESEEKIRDELNKYRQCFDENVEKFIQNNLSNDLYDGNIANIARSIENKIENLGFFCKNCENVFKENDKVTTSPICSQQPCKTTFDICKLH